MINWVNPNIEEFQYSSSQCAGSSQCLEMHSLSEVMLEATLRWGLIVLVLYSIILLNYFIIYKRKKDSSPIKHAFKSTWLWLVALLVIVPLVMVISFYYIFNR